MSNLSERGQHTSHEGVGGDNGQRHLVRDPELGKGKAVPPSAPDADIETQSGVERNANDGARRFPAA